MKTYTLKPLYKKPLYNNMCIWLEFKFSILQKLYNIYIFLIINKKLILSLQL